MANNTPEPTWRTQAGGSRRPAKAYAWKPTEPEATGSWKRHLKLFVLAGTGLVVVGGIVALILLLLQPYRPGLLALAADPKYADQLDVPYDPYGWLSAKRLLAWAETAAEDHKSPAALISNPEWVDNWDIWLNPLRREKIDPLVIYIGLHGGVGPDNRPILYTGRNPRAKEGPPTITVLELIDKLNSIPDKRKVLVLDVSRGLPDPILGELHYDFVRAMQSDEIQQKIRESPNLVVICGANNNQRGWESTDLGMTALAYHLLKGLAGEAAPQNMRAFTADDLFQYVHREVSQWAKNNRPNAQEPLLLPDPQIDKRATTGYEYRKFLVADNPPSPTNTPAPTQVPDTLRNRWVECEALARQNPGPHTYTPLAWRRYRELLLRYENAVVAGDATGEEVLASALEITANRIRSGLQLDLASIGWTLTWPVAAGKPSSDSLRDVLKKVTDSNNTIELQQAATQVTDATRNRPQRPIEAHFLLMTNHFHTSVLSQPEKPANDLWKRTVRTRLLAEQAAIGVGENDFRYPYSEYLWPILRTTILNADSQRRLAEDSLFAEAGDGRDYHRRAEEGLQLAESQYKDALDAIRAVQEGLRIRDELFADLPFLTRWLSEADSLSPFVAESHELAKRLWINGHDLSARLDTLAAKAALPAQEERITLSQDAAELAARLKTIKDTYAAQVAAAGSTTIQSQLQSIEALLLVPVPIIDTPTRLQLLENRRQIERKLYDGSTPMLGEPAPIQTEKIRRRAEAIVHALGDADWKQQIDRQMRQHDLATTMAKVLNGDTDLSATTQASVAAVVNWRAIDTAVTGTNKPEQRMAAERFSRVAVARSDIPQTEPAVVNQRVRWRALLEGQAARIARDHWYDEKGERAFAIAANSLLNDATTLADQIGERDAQPSEDARDAVALLKVPGLDLMAEVTGSRSVDGNVLWTTETVRELRCTIAPVSSLLTGSAAVWVVSDKADILTIIDGRRDLTALPASSTRPTDPRVVRVVPGNNLSDTAGPSTSFVKVQATGFFRGQVINANVRFAVNTRPDLVVTETQPEPGAMIALRAGSDFDPGAIGFVLDYSGSMRFQTDGKTLPPNEDRDPSSKMSQALAALERVFPSIPDRTNVKVRIFSHQNPGKRESDELIFPNRNYFASDQFNGQRAADILRVLRGFRPYYDTPLIGTIRKAIQEDLAGPDTVKTLVVLTDGLDTTYGDISDPRKPMTAAQKQEVIRKVQNDVRALRDAARERNISIHMVFFALGEDNEAAREMFRDLDEVDSTRTTASRIWQADDADGLINRLDRILRPKPRLLHKGGRLVEEVPAFGMPVNRANEGPGELFWYGPRKIDTASVDTYDLRYAGAGVELRLAAGDRMAIRLGSDPGRRVNFTREVYYRDVDRLTPGHRIYDEHEAWFLAVPGYNYARRGRHYLMVTAALEAKSRPLSDPGEVLRQPRPRFIWWDLVRLDGTTERSSNGTVYVRNIARNQLPAPAWRIIADDGPTANTSRNRLRAYTLGDREPDPLVAFSVSSPNRLDSVPHTEVIANEPITVQLNLEPAAFYPDPEVDTLLKQPAGTREFCLVIRATDAKGRILQARVRELQRVPTREHRYFYQRDREAIGSPPPIAAYTGIFGPVNREFLAGLPELRIELVSVNDVINDPRAARLPIDLGTPISGQVPPQVIEPGLTADLKLP